MSGMNGWLLHNRHTQHHTPAGKTHKYQVAFVRRLETRTGQEAETGSADRNHVPEIGTGSQYRKHALTTVTCILFFSTESF